MKGKIMFLIVLVVLSAVVIADEAPSRKILVKKIGAPSDVVGASPIFARRYDQLQAQKERRLNVLKEQQSVRREVKAAKSASLARIQAKRAGPHERAGTVTRFKPRPELFPAPRPSKFRTSGWYQG